MRARRAWAWPLVPVYRVGLGVKEWLRAAGVLRVKRLGWPVVSVGSLSAGGAGKTPVVMALAEMLTARGWGVDVLSRGYGRTGRGVERVEGADAARFGDEPVVMARRGLEVWVGGDRYKAGVEAERARGEGRGVHLLDDGMQHRGLERAVEVVVVTAEDLEDVLLPAGNLREGLGGLRRADVVVVRAEEMEVVEPKLRALLGGRWPGAGEGLVGVRAPRYTRGKAKVEVLAYLEAGGAAAGSGPGAASGPGGGVVRGVPAGAGSMAGGPVRGGVLVWTVRRRLVFPGPLFVFGAGLRPVAFCAIARPEGFAGMLLEAGCGVVETVFFADHHAFAMGDMERVVEVATGLKATGLVTTEKDAVKLSGEMMKVLERVGPVMVVGLAAEMVFPERVARELEARLVRETAG